MSNYIVYYMYIVYNLRVTSGSLWGAHKLINSHQIYIHDSSHPLHVHVGSMEALPAARIADIVTASSLSDDDIQQLIDQLLDKMNTNAEWQGVSSSLLSPFFFLFSFSPSSVAHNTSQFLPHSLATL